MSDYRSAQMLEYAQPGFILPNEYKKEDPVRAWAVMDHIYRTLNGRHGPVVRDILADLEPWLMDVFRAVRGEHA